MKDASEIKSNSAHVWGATPAGITFGQGFPPGTREFFENVLAKRSTYEQPWLFQLVPFSAFRTKKVLELGCGAGYDAYEICRNGAEYTGLDLAPQNAERTRSHLAFYDLSPHVLVGDAENLMFPDEQFDVVFSNGVLHHTPDIEKSFQEAHRVLKHGGEFWVVLYHRDSVFYWFTVWFYGHIIRLGFLRRPFKQRLSMIEYTTSDRRPLVNVYTSRSIRALLHRSGFQTKHIWVRKLVKEDFPRLPLLRHLWSSIPQSWFNLIGRWFGWYLIVQAHKQ